MAFNVLNAGRFSLGASCVGGSKYVLNDRGEICQGTHSVWQAHWRFRADPRKTGGDGHPDICGGIHDLSQRRDMEPAMHAAGEGGDKAQHTMKVLEEYAIESSIGKVYGSEMLDFVGG